MLKKTFKIPDMHCANCSMRIESIEDDLPGIKQVNASYHKQNMVVEYDETRLTDEQIIAAVKKKGYQAIPAQS
jgi:copper chaperone CopZ